MRTNKPAYFFQHIIPHTEDCPACRAIEVELSRKQDITKLTFKQAAQVVLDDERKEVETGGETALAQVLFAHEPKSKKRIGKRTYKDHQDFTRRLNAFFADFPLDKINTGHLRAYQLHRLGFRVDDHGKEYRAEGAGPTLINHELSFLAKVLDHAGLWKELKPKYQRLKEPKSEKGRVLDEQKESELIAGAATKPRWIVMYCGILLQVNAGTGPGEICHLRVKDYRRRERMLEIREGGGPVELYVDGPRGGPKNKWRHRDIPLNDAAVWACEQLLFRYQRICKRRKIEPDLNHYLIPQRGDPTKPFGSWQKSWVKLCKEANLPGLHRYHLRHQVSTKMQEDERTPKEVINHVLGHAPGSKTAQEVYRHIREQKAREALNRVEVKPAPPKLVASTDEPLKKSNVVAIQRSKAARIGSQ